MCCSWFRWFYLKRIPNLTSNFHSTLPCRTVKILLRQNHRNHEQHIHAARSQGYRGHRRNRRPGSNDRSSITRLVDHYHQSTFTNLPNDPFPIIRIWDALHCPTTPCVQSHHRRDSQPSRRPWGNSLLTTRRRCNHQPCHPSNMAKPEEGTSKLSPLQPSGYRQNKMGPPSRQSSRTHPTHCGQSQLNLRSII